MAEAVPARLELLFRARGQAAANRLAQAVREAPIRIATAVVLVGLIWLGLFGLFRMVFAQLERTPLEATVAVPLVFNFFFASMLVLLAFSNAIIVHGALFGKTESPYLLTLPIAPLDVVTFKYLECLVLSSWSLVLLGLPMMFAMAVTSQQWLCYALFVAFFLAFIPIPGALGLILAFGVARFFPRKALRVVTILSAVLLVMVAVAAVRALRLGDTATEVWLRAFLMRMSFVQSALLPNNWVAAGIDHAAHGRFDLGLLYLSVTAANAFFLSWIAVRLVSRHLDAAYDRATSGRGGALRRTAPASGGICGWAFWYLPLPLRLVAAKDLRTFIRDPAQWSQLTILFGLLVLYLANMPTLRLEFSASGWFLFIPFLNLCAVSLILATFTCRFVFPLVSLEGQKLWLMGVLPMSRGRILWAKLAFSMTVTLAVALSAMTLAAYMLNLGTVWASIHLMVTIAVCFGLCAFSVGIGARMPMFHEVSSARIASGLGGTTNLLASVAMVCVVLTGVGIATFRSRYLPSNALPDMGSLGLCALAVAAAVVCGVVALWAGARHFNRVQV